jgi:hypothetical protein
VLIFPSLFLLFGDDDVLGVLRVQDDGDEARLVRLAGVPGDAVQAAGRFVEGVTGLKDLGFVVVDGPLVLALQDVPERRAGVTCAASTWPGASVTATVVAFAFFPSSFSMMSFWESSLT